jgi:DNA helicase-2/ATP-dependent DNA helicase PcrA
MPSTDPLATLNPAQRTAVTTTEGPLLVVAGPGSGKTAVITQRIAHLIRRGVSSQQIVALTFTNKAADEMKSRVAQLVDRHDTWVSTFHKFCARLLRTYGTQIGIAENFTIYDAADARAALKEAFERADMSSRHFSLEQMGQAIAQAKHYGIDFPSFAPRPGHAQDAAVAKIYRAYDEVLRGANALDFDDLLLQTVVLLRESEGLRASLDDRFQYILVDEYQDTNAAQFAIVRALSMDHPNLCVAGDPDQSIYGWRGANLDNLLKFEQHFRGARIVRLEHNYRSTQSILRVADQLIQNNVHRLPKALVTDNEPGVPVRLVAYPQPQLEAADIADQIAVAIQRGLRSPKDFAILYRANWLSRSFEHELRARQIPYLIVHGHEFYQRKEIKDVFAYLSLLHNPHNHIALQRIINVPTRRIGQATVNKLKADAADRGCSLFEAARNAGLSPRLSKQSAAKVAAFVALIDRLGEIRTEASVETIVERVVEWTDYRESLIRDDTADGHERAANVDELITAAAEFDQMHPDDGGLEAFLEMSSLVNDVDDWETETSAVSLMTLHAAKGLEFPVVYIVGLEDGLLPHERNMHAELELEEERRLLFVGMTRAEVELQLSRNLTRFRGGQSWQTIASRFLMELPRHQMDVSGPSAFEFYGPDEGDLGGDPDEGDLDFDPDSLIAPPATRPTPNPGPGFKLMTGSQMLEQGAASPIVSSLPVEQFRPGMLVEHPEYGAGVVTELSGNGNKRVATVCFADQKRSFRLAHAPLRLAAGSPVTEPSD